MAQSAASRLHLSPETAAHVNGDDPDRSIGYEFLFVQKPARDLPRAKEPKWRRSIANVQTRLPGWHT